MSQEPAWLLEAVVLAVHQVQLAEHGGAPGVRDLELLRSALARPRNLLAYAEVEPTLFELAASYAYGLVRNHCFVDGNKRVALVAALTFLADHGWRLAAPRAETYAKVMQLASGQLTESDFGGWLERSCERAAGGR